MRAVTVTEYGATPAVAEIPTPEPGPGQVLIRLRAAGMNPMDRSLASGAWKPMPATFPMVLGVDGAGVLEQLGPAASRFSIGDDLFGQLLIAPLGSAGRSARIAGLTGGGPPAVIPSVHAAHVSGGLPPAGCGTVRVGGGGCGPRLGVGGVPAATHGGCGAGRPDPAPAPASGSLVPGVGARCPAPGAGGPR